MLFARSNNGTGIRKDAYANAHRIRVEVDNPSGSSAGVRIIPTGQASPPVRFGYWTGTTGRRPRLGATWAKGARRARQSLVPQEARRDRQGTRPNLDNRVAGALAREHYFSKLLFRASEQR